MKFIGNIVTDSKVLKIPFYNVVETLEEIDKSVPTLIIGWYKVKEYYPNVKILEWKISDDMYWTFGRREKGERYETDIEKFKQICLKKLFKTVQYVFFNVLTEEEERKKKLFKYLKTTNITAYIENDIFYFYNNRDIVYGMSLRDIEYESGTKKKFLAFVLGSKNINFVDKESVTYEVKMLLKGKISMIPYIFSK